MSKDESVYDTNTAFYAAVESLDIQRMHEVWLREPYITCAHSGAPLLVGWGPIMRSWERLFDQTFTLKIVLADVQAHVSAAIAWTVVTERIESHHYDGISTGTVCTTNVFERRGGRWFIVHHHSSPVHQAPDPSTDKLQ